MAPTVILALLCSVLVPTHAAATSDGVGDPFDKDTWTPGSTTDENGTPTDEDESGPGSEMPEELVPDGPVGPVGSTDVPTYEALWAPGETVPSDLKVIHNNEDVDLLAIAPQDGSSLMALLIIRDEDTPTEYRFENAVPAGYTAELHTDGSVRFFDAAGDEVGGIGVPWAIDALNNPVATSFRLDGSTLVQTVEHEGAAYPVVADPVWAPVVSAVYVCGVYPQCVNGALTVARFAPGLAGQAIGAAWSARTWLVTGNGGGSANRPTNSCNMRNRQGC